MVTYAMFKGGWKRKTVNDERKPYVWKWLNDPLSKTDWHFETTQPHVQTYLNYTDN